MISVVDTGLVENLPGQWPKEEHRAMDASAGDRLWPKRYAESWENKYLWQVRLTQSMQSCLSLQDHPSVSIDTEA